MGHARIAHTSASRAHEALALACVALACLGLASGCGPSRTLEPGETAPVRLGLIVPLSGELGADGPSWRDAVVLAVREVNAAGGVLPGRAVDLSIRDGESRPDIGVRVAQQLVGQGVVGIVGDAASSSTIRIYQEVTLEAQVLLASGLSTSPQLTEINDAQADTGGWYFFRTVPPDDGQAPALAEAMYGAPYACRRIAILYADNDYGRPFQEGVRQRFTQFADGAIAIEQPYTEALGSYTTEVNAVAAAMPDCIALIAYPQSAGQIIRDWSAIAGRPPVRWFGTDGVRQPGFATEVGDPSLIDGFLGTAPVTDARTPAYNRFESAYRSIFGGTPTAFASNLYDAAALMMLAIAKAGTDADPVAIRDAVLELNDPAGTVVQAGRLGEGLRLLREGRAINYEGASGPVIVDEHGNVGGVYELWRFDAATSSFVQVSILE